MVQGCDVFLHLCSHLVCLFCPVSHLQNFIGHIRMLGAFLKRSVKKGKGASESDVKSGVKLGLPGFW